MALIAGPCVTVARTTFAPPSFVQLGGGVGGLAVDVVGRAELRASGSLSCAAGDADGAEAHLGRVLHAEVPEPAEAEDRDRSPGRAPLLRRALKVVSPAHMSGAASAAGSSAGTSASAVARRDHVVGVAAVERRCRSPSRPVWQAKKSPRRQLSHDAAVPRVPPDADALPGLPARRHVRAHASITPTTSCPGTRGYSIPGSGPLLGERVAVADAAGLHLDPHGAGGRLGDRALDEFERTAGAGDLDGTHVGMVGLRGQYMYESVCSCIVSRRPLSAGTSGMSEDEQHGDDANGEARAARFAAAARRATRPAARR